MITQGRIFVLLLLITFCNVFGKVNTLEIGATAPDFKLVGIDDKNYTLDNFSDADVLGVIFTANHCRYITRLRFNSYQGSFATTF